MRIHRLLLSCLVLSAMAFGQATNSPSSSSTTQDPNQAPQSPLQEPAKQDPLAQQKQQPSDFGNRESVAGKDQVLGEMKLMFRNTELGGNFQQRSFLTPGENLLGEMNIFSDQRFVGEHRFQMLSMYRGTNDRSIDPEQNSLQKAYVRIYGPNDDTTIGDALVNYSRLTFNQNIKGASTSWKFGRLRAMATGGIYADRWGSLYHSVTDNPGRPYTAAVAGGRLELQVAKRTTLGWNYSNYEDKLSSLPYVAIVPGLTPAAPFPATNRIGSMDFKTQIGSLRLMAEAAESATIFDKRISQNYQTDWGGVVEGSWRYKRLSVRGSMVRYQPYFASFNARQISDLQDWVSRVSFDAAHWLTIEGTGRRSNNNLRKQTFYETVSWGPEGRLIFHDLPFYKRLVLEAGYRQRLTFNTQENAAYCAAQRTFNPTACLGDRSVAMPYGEITLPIKTTFLTLGYERRQVQDFIDPSQTSNANRVYVSFRGIYDLGGWHLNPVFRYEFERTGQRQELSAPNFIDRLDYDNNRLGTASLFIETPRYFIIELAFRDASSTFVSFIPDPRSAVFPAAQIFAPAGYSRPQYKANLTYKIANDENKLIVFSFERNNNFYFAPSPNYDERVIGVSIIYKFGRRGK